MSNINPIDNTHVLLILSRRRMRKNYMRTDENYALQF